MEDYFLRTELMLGKNAMDKLKNSKVAIFGLGGVGSYAAEGIIRSGVGNIDIFDGDVFDVTNINRQLSATTKTIGLSKAKITKGRMLDINPNANINAYECFFCKENEKDYDFSKYSYIIDAIDTITSKILIIKKAKACSVPVISCMGTGNKMNPFAFEITDISKTSVCPVAKVMRRELKKLGITNLKVLYSKEKPLYKPKERKINASISFVPPVAGFILAGEVIKDLIK